MSKAGLYFHIPFCLRKCAYCDFCSFTGKTDEDMRRYTDALIREMEAYADAARGMTFDTLFFGGGTPSLLPADAVSRILGAAVRLFSIEKDAEITLEANPATADKAKLAALRSLGINRLSMGVQSLDDRELTLLGRLHNAREALTFFSDAREAGFDNINVDLMYGIPEQTVASAEKTLRTVLSLSPEHISAYSLMLEEGTPLYDKRSVLSFPDEEGENAIDGHIRAILGEHGYLHYEISNDAKEGYASRHNLHYWRSDSYLGFGVAAYSFFGGARYGNGTDFAAYIADPESITGAREVLTQEDLAYEFIMLRFRLAEGLSLSEYKSRFGKDFKETFSEPVTRFTAMGLMAEKEDRIFLTEQGFRVSNSILLEFMSD